MTYTPPPLVVDSARVVAYAFVDDIAYSKWGALYVGGELLEHVPRLAICVNLQSDRNVLLFHCDVDWEVLGATSAATVLDLKARAEKNYPGVAARWIETGTTEEAALDFYDRESAGMNCSVCGRRPCTMNACIERESIVVCDECRKRG